MDILVQILWWTVTTAIFLFVIVSVVLFIKDGIRAKREGTGRKKKYTVMFIISMAITALAAVLAILLSILAVSIMRSM